MIIDIVNVTGDETSNCKSEFYKLFQLLNIQVINLSLLDMLRYHYLTRCELITSSIIERECRCSLILQV